MKRFLTLVLAVVLVATLLVGCGGSNTEKSSESEKATTEKTPEKQKEKDVEKKSNKVLAGMAIRSFSNPYYVQLQEGAELFAATQPEGSVELQMMPSEGNDEKQINDIESLIARGGKDTIVYVDPNQAPNAAAIAEICEEAGVYWSTTWSTAEGLHPRDYEYYVFHQTLDDQQSGYDIAKAMFESFDTPGEGKIVAIQGMLANSASIDRFKGLERALEEYPNVELLDAQPADWNPQKALTLTETWLSTYDDMDGIWVANDSMALAAVEALRAKSLNGKVLVAGVDGIPDAITAIQNGDMIATVFSNPYLQGGYALAILKAAHDGKFDTKAMKEEQMAFLTKGVLVSGNNVDDFIAEFVDSKPAYDYSNYFDCVFKGLDLK